MEVSGTLILKLPVQTGTSKNGPWKKSDFVIETKDKFPKKICISAWNELADEVDRTPLNQELKVSFDLSSREYNGKWYTDIKAWKITGTSAAAPPKDTPEYIPPFTDVAPDDDGLPF